MIDERMLSPRGDSVEADARGCSRMVCCSLPGTSNCVSDIVAVHTIWCSVHIRGVLASGMSGVTVNTIRWGYDPPLRNS